MAEQIADLASITPLEAYADRSRINPGDLTQYAPDGFGSVPAVIRPGDKLEDVGKFDGFYGLREKGADPIRGAPANDPAGGVLYFRGERAGDLETILKTMGFMSREKSYKVFFQRSDDTKRDRYLDQLRIVTRYAMAGLFRVRGADITEQRLTIGELIPGFVALQQEVGNPHGDAFSRNLSGIMGGDGDWAKEALAFGLMVENAYWGVYRVWSRPWLVTK